MGAQILVWVLFLPAVWNWASQLATLSFVFLIKIMGAMHMSMFSFLSNNTSFMFLLKYYQVKSILLSLLSLSGFWGISLKGELTVAMWHFIFVCFILLLTLNQEATVRARAAILNLEVILRIDHVLGMMEERVLYDCRNASLALDKIPT